MTGHSAWYKFSVVRVYTHYAGSKILNLYWLFKRSQLSNVVFGPFSFEACIYVCLSMWCFQEFSALCVWFKWGFRYLPRTLFLHKRQCICFEYGSLIVLLLLYDVHWEVIYNFLTRVLIFERLLFVSRAFYLSWSFDQSCLVHICNRLGLEYVAVDSDWIKLLHFRRRIVNCSSV